MDLEMFSQNLEKSLVRPATRRPLVDPDFKVVLTDLDHIGFSRVRSHIDPDQHASKDRRESEIAEVCLLISGMTRIRVMAVTPYPHQQPRLMDHFHGTALGLA